MTPYPLNVFDDGAIIFHACYFTLRAADRLLITNVSAQKGLSLALSLLYLSLFRQTREIRRSGCEIDRYFAWLSARQRISVPRVSSSSILVCSILLSLLLSLSLFTLFTPKLGFSLHPLLRLWTSPASLLPLQSPFLHGGSWPVKRVRGSLLFLI